jgi:hypothetical protein
MLRCEHIIQLFTFRAQLPSPLYPLSTLQTSNVSGDDLERQNDRSSPNSVPPFHLVIPGHVQVQPHKYTDGHYLIVVPEATAPRSGR